VEFPRDESLRCFDLSDRKFVAVARNSKNHPEIVNAVDSDWDSFRGPLLGNGVVVRCLCPKRTGRRRCVRRSE
jgi:hypothetical protein